jgi:hypothetical protein
VAAARRGSTLISNNLSSLPQWISILLWNQ